MGGPAAKKERVVLAGPCPPPDSGTTVNFKLFTDYVQQHFEVETVILDFGRGGSKLGLPWFHWKILHTFLERSWKMLRGHWGSRTIVIHGSYRFMCTAAVLYTWALAVLFRKRVFLYVNAGGFDEYMHSLHPAARRLVMGGLRCAAGVQVQTECSGEVFRGQLPNICAVPNWRPLPASVGRGEVRPAGSVRFVYAGELRREKGIAELLAAFREVRRKLAGSGIAATLDLYGPLFQEVNDEVRVAVEASASVRWHGSISNRSLMMELASYDVLVFPTKCCNEGHPGVVIEAMAMGLPVVATRWRSAGEVIEDGVTGLICPSSDPAALAESMCRIAQDGKLRRRLGANAPRAAARFDAASVLPRLCSLYGLDVYRREARD